MLLLLELEMTNQHPIQPSPELVDQWSALIYQVTGEDNERDFYIATQAAQWGADQELAACLEWMFREPVIHEIVGRDGRYLDFELRAARRPQPLSLKEQALTVLDDCTDQLSSAHENILRRALEALPND